MAKIREFSVSRGIPIPYKTELIVCLFFGMLCPMLTWELFPKNSVAHCSEPKTNFFSKKRELFGRVRFLVFAFCTKKQAHVVELLYCAFCSPISLFAPHPQKLACSLLHVAIFVFKLFCFIMSRMITKTQEKR